jgi:peptide/nickel transport system substrate-binding protein
MKKGRLRQLIAAGLAAAMLSIGGCSLGASGGAEGGGTSTSAANTDKLTIAISADVSTLNPWMTRSISDLNILSQVYTSLVVRDADMNLQPALATKWEQTDSTTWRFTLRDDVKFENGKTLDADVVKWNIEQVMDPDTDARVASTFDKVTNVNVVNATTIDITTSEPNLTLPDALTTFFFLEPTWAADHDAAQEMMGTGPYELADRQIQQSITLEKRSDSVWADEAAYKAVEYRVISEDSSRVAALQTGEVDLITQYGPDEISSLQSTDGIEAGAIETTRSVFLYADATKEPMNNTLVRQAINYAIDKESIVKSLFGGLTDISAGQVLTPEYRGYNEGVEAYPYDPDKAKELLKEAGYSDGLEVTFIYATGYGLLTPETAQAITSQLAEVGITADVSTMPSADFTNMNYERTNLPNLGYLTYAWWTLDGADLLENFMTGGAQQFWQNDDFDAAMTSALGASTLDEREKYTEQAVEIMRDEAGFIFLFPQPLTYAYNKEKISYTPRPDDWLRATEITPAE